VDFEFEFLDFRDFEEMVELLEGLLPLVSVRLDLTVERVSKEDGDT
jgi:hypothetical protein